MSKKLEDTLVGFFESQQQADDDFVGETEPPTRLPTLEEQSEQRQNRDRARRDALYISNWNEDGWA